MKDGTSESLKNLEKSFADLARQIKLGDTTGISYKITVLNIHPFTGRFAMMSYQDETKLVRVGVLLRDLRTKCTT